MQGITQQGFSHIYVDLVGPLPTSKEGYHKGYLFTIIEAVPTTGLHSMEAVVCVNPLIAYLRYWIARFRASAPHLTLDQGDQFTSSLWVHACQA